MPDQRASSRPRAAFYVQHLLGIGHLVRAFRVADAMAGEGWRVDLLVGGVVPAGLSAGAARIVQLPPVRAASSGLSALAHPDGSIFGEADQRDRRARLIDHVSATRPDILLIEAFPFGRRQMQFELLPLLELCRAWPDPPLIATSVRDILQEARNPARPAETKVMLDRFFDMVLVHGDPALARFEDTFPGADAIASKIRYTGLVAPSPAQAPAAGRNRFEVVVSAGGGAVGSGLLRAALAARPLTRYARSRWLLLTGPNFPRETRDELSAAATPDVVVETFVPELSSILRTSAVSVSQAGYNTVADILAAGCAAVLVPFAADGETEQTARANRLAARGRAEVVTEAELDAHRLAQAIDAASNLSGLKTVFALDGAQNTAAILSQALAERRTRPV